MSDFVYVLIAHMEVINVAYVVAFLNQKQHCLIHNAQCISGRQRVRRA